jgi:hypothetical protein
MNRVGIAAVAMITAFTVSGCAGEQRYDPLEEFEELNITTVIDAPGPEPGRYSAIDRDAIDRGEYTSSSCLLVVSVTRTAHLTGRPI